MSDVKLSAAGDGRTDRGGSEPGPRVPRRGAAQSRHGAIARDLTKYASYKSWADKVRGVFAADADQAPGVDGNTDGVNGKR